MPADDAALDLVEDFAARPEIAAAAARANTCGPIAYALAAHLRSHGLPAALLRLGGSPVPVPGSAALAANPHLGEDGSGHYLVVLDGTALDLAFRQFDPAAPAVLAYPAERIENSWEPWTPWEEIIDQIAPDQPLDPFFASYGAVRGDDLLARTAAA